MIAVRYHDSTKHHFNRFARSLGYLDWATQPDPFRRYVGAPVHELPRTPLDADVPYPALFDRQLPPQPITHHAVGEFLRCSMGLSAWKQYGQSRWALRVNPSSGNLHPTEAWVVFDGCVFHYAPREHALEQRCAFDGGLMRGASSKGFLVALSSIVWREAWKYGERAFRYCQHDTGHALGAMRLAASMLGWQMRVLPEWSDADVAALLGLDRDADFVDAEREEPECVALVSYGDDSSVNTGDPKAAVDTARTGSWSGRANRLSSDHVSWPIIDEVAAATRYPGRRSESIHDRHETRGEPRTPWPVTSQHAADRESRSGRATLLQRRSALGFDGRSSIERTALMAMLRRLQPGAPPWDVIDWPPHVHLILFLHRVQGIVPGIYAYLRSQSVLGEWKQAMRAEFLWEEVDDRLFLLVPIEAGRIAKRLSCDQDIAEDGFLAVAMLARFEASLAERGEWFYRRLFWECGLIGQMLYVEAEAAAARATGIGCYYDDPVHDVLGLSGHGWQSLYHFSIGVPVEDARLTTEPGYPWEVIPAP